MNSKIRQIFAFQFPPRVQIIKDLYCDTFFLISIWTILFFVWLLIHPLTPGLDIQENPGWWKWWDQSSYLTIAKEVYNLSPETDSFWPGYSILAAFFLFVIPSNPFLILSYFMGLLITINLHAILTNNLGRLEAFIVAIILTGLSYKYIYQGIIIPWNTIGIYLFFSYLIKLIDYQDWSLVKLYRLSFLANLAFFLRPQDGVFAIFLYFIVLLLYVDRKYIKNLLLVSFLSFVFLNSFTLLYFISVWSGDVSFYITENISHGFSYSNFFERFYSIFYNGDYYFQGEYPKTTFLNTSPSILYYNPFCSFGIIFLVLKSIFDKKIAFVTFCNLSLISFYLFFNPTGNAVHFWMYSLFHYIWIYVTIISIYGYLGIRDLFRSRFKNGPSKASFVLFCVIVLIEPTREQLPVSFIQNDNVITMKVSEENIKKIKIEYEDNSNQKLYHPSNLNILTLRLNGVKLTIWKDYYLNSGIDWDSIIFINSIRKPGQLDIILTDGETKKIKSLESVELNFF